MSPILPENVHWRLKQVHTGQIFDINETDNFMVGRNKTAQISLNSNKTSRQHSSFVVNIEGHLLMQDLKSINGTYINGTQISLNVLHRLSPGDEISFGIADIELAEDNRDRQTFFVVICDMPLVQNIESNLVDLTTGGQGNKERNLLLCKQDSAKNSMAEPVVNSFLKLPSSSTKKEDPLEIIEILSSNGDDEKPDIDLNDCLEVENEQPHFQIADETPERQKPISNNWLQKPRRSTGSNNNTLTTPKDGAVNKKAAKRRPNLSMNRKNLAELDPEIETNNRLSKTDRDLLRRKNSFEEARLLQKSKTAESRSNVTGLKVKKTVIVPPKRKSLVTDEKKDTEHIDKKKDTAGQKSNTKGTTTFKKQSFKVPQIENIRTTNPEAKKPAVRRKSLAVANPEQEDDSRNKNKNSLRRKSIAAVRNSSMSEVVGNQKKDKLLEDDLSAKKFGIQEKLKNSVPWSSKRTSFNKLDTEAPGKKGNEYTSIKKSLTADSFSKNKDCQAKNDKPMPTKSSEKESLHIYEKKITSAKVSSRRSSVVAEGKTHHNKRKLSVEDSLKNTKSDKYNDDLLMQLDQAISGNDEVTTLQPASYLSKSAEINQKDKEIINSGNFALLPPKTAPSRGKISDTAKTDDKYTKCNKKFHKKVKTDDCNEEFIFNRLTTPREEETRENSPLKDINSMKSTKENNLMKEKDKKIDHDRTEKPDDSGNNFTSFKEPTVRNISVHETTFTTDKDNSVIYDITEDDDDDNDDMDFSCSQIFHMSQMVKTEVQDDTFQKIKNELAEMEFCEEETILNPVPINLEENMSGFENTQDICAYLEEGAENNDNFISNEENEELLKILGDLEQDSGNEEQDMDSTLCESSKEETSHTKIECSKFFGKSKYVKPPVIEPHTIAKPRKDLPKVSPSNQSIGVNKEIKSNKRKNSLETPLIKKKLKGSPRSVAEPPRCDSKSIHMEFKKRNSTSKVEQDKLQKLQILELRRKKLKEITERHSLPEVVESKAIKGNTVKVLPDYKTRRGSYLCEEPKNNDLVATQLSSHITKRDSKDASSNLLCKCHEPGTSGQQRECAVHTKNLCNGPNGINLNKMPDNNYTNVRPPRRCKTPTKELFGHNLNPIDLPEPTYKYNLRKTKSSGDIRADLAKANDHPRPAHNYNLRHSATMEDNRSKVIQNAFQNFMKHDVRQSNSFAGHAAPHSVPVNRGLQYAMPPQYNQMDTMPAAPHHIVSRPTSALSRKLMWGNGGPSINRRPPIKRLPPMDEVVQKMVNWLPNWLTEQVNIDSSAPINSPPARKIPLNFRNYDQYYNIFSKLVLLENWQYLYKGFREGTEQPRKVKVEHVRIANDLMTMDCISYITQKEVRQGQFYKPEDFVLVECVMNDKSNSYISLSFGFIQRCKKSIISNDDVISIRPDMRHGVPHTKLEFSIVTRYQPGKEINKKKFPIVKLLANIRAHLMMIRAVKMLAESPICSKILHPKINEYKVAVAYRDIIQPHSLNTQQRTIVLEAASLCTGKGQGLYCIKGPPGTGKSTVIVNLVFQILFSHYVTKKTKEPPMILLAAPSNTAVDNLLAKLIAFKHCLPTVWDKYKAQIKCVRIGPESSISKELIGYSLPKLAEKHMPTKHMEVPEFRAARDRNENLFDFAKTFFGDRYGYELKACEDLIIEKSNIICTTLNSCINGKLIEAVNRGLIKFSCCIIDEATQCHEVEALLPTILGIDKFVLVGDPKQLNATIMNRDASKLGFGESLFSRISTNFTNDPRTPIRMLTDQYRMHPEICAFPNRRFYDGKLKSVPNPPNKLPEKIRPYLVFNCEKVNDSSDYTNVDEVNLLKILLGTLFGMIDKNHKYTVGIITPYNAQKDLIGSNIYDLVSKNANCKITVNTVDSFQGSENDIVIISCVRDSTNSFLQNENRLNVALTRAKQALYIIGNYTLFKECRTLYDLREDAKKRKLLLDIRQDPKSIDNFSKYLLKKKN